MRTNNRGTGGSRSRSVRPTEGEANIPRGRRAEALATARARRSRKRRAEAVGAVVGIVVAIAATTAFARLRQDHPHSHASSSGRTTPSSSSRSPASSTPVRPAASATNPPATTAGCTRVIAPPSSIGAAEATAKPGDVLCLRGGFYEQLVDLTQSGTPTAALTVTGVPGERAVIDGAKQHPGGGVLQLQASYLIVRAVTVQNSSQFGIANLGHHNTVQGCLIQGTVRSGLVTAGWRDENDHNWYDHNEVTRTVLSNASDKLGAGGWDSAIDNVDGRGASGNNLYTNNVVHDNWGEGQTLADNDILRSNTYFDNWSTQVFLDGKQNVTIEKNLIYTTYRQRPPYARQLGTGIGLADETSPARSSSDIIRNNVIENVGTGMYYWNSGTTGTGLKHDLIDDNTVVNTWNCGICFDAAAHTGTLLRDNLVVPRSGTVAAGTNASGISAAANLFTTRGAGTDPHLAGEGIFSYNADDYRLTRASVSAIDRGVSSSATDDYAGTARPVGARGDIGAFELH